MKTLAMTHSDAVRLAEWLANEFTPPLTEPAAILTGAIAEAEDAAICDDVFIDLVDSESWNVRLAAMAAGITHKVV